jgi:mannose PTS system EIIA component
MVGIVIVTHSQLGDALIEAAEFILGSKPEATIAVSVDLKENAEKLRGKIDNAIKKVRHPQGVLILTDMFGGTPSNLSYSFLEEGKIEVISGVNLPILIKATSARQAKDLGELATFLESFGKRSISLASSILKGNKRGH